jgi:acyl carrier protein
MSSASADTSIRDTIFAIVAKQGKIDPAILKPESTLKDLGIASLTAIEVLFEIEERFDIDFPDQSADLDTGTLQHLVDAVEGALAKKNAKAS